MKSNTVLSQEYAIIIDGLKLEDTQKALLKTTWLDYLLLMNVSAKKGWRNYNYSQLIVIFLSLIIPVLEGTKLKNFDFFGWDLGGLTLISILSLIVAALTAINRQMGFDAKWRHYRKNAEMMRNEGDDYLGLSGNYEKFNDHSEAFRPFIKSITSFKRQEVNSYLENDSEKKSTNTN